LLDKQDFKDIIVCFDDFERLSSSMELKEVLGLISELKEQKNCSVVMILNEDELRDNKETLDKYKEKLILLIRQSNTDANIWDCYILNVLCSSIDPLNR
jgi:mannose-6-phosphate isomerase class I